MGTMNEYSIEVVYFGEKSLEVTGVSEYSYGRRSFSMTKFNGEKYVIPFSSKVKYINIEKKSKSVYGGDFNEPAG